MALRVFVSYAAREDQILALRLQTHGEYPTGPTGLRPTGIHEIGLPVREAR